MSMKRNVKRLIGDLVNPLMAPIVSKYAFDIRYSPLWERYGFHVVPDHFYSPIPNRRDLDTSVWETESELMGIDMNEDEQLMLLTSVFPRFVEECDFAMTPTGSESAYYIENGAFESVDAEVLHCMVRHFLPARMIEIGAGNSTLVAARACLLNRERSGVETKLTTIDPYPPSYLQDELPGLTQLLDRPVERVGMELFLSLEEDDILFIDSSHVIRTGGDVNYEFLEIVPRLNRGVIVHVHDIYLPAEYPRAEVLDAGLFFTEQYLVQAFLAFNAAFEIIWAASYMHLRHPELLGRCFPSYARGDWWPASFWLRRRA